MMTSATPGCVLPSTHTFNPAQVIRSYISWSSQNSELVPFYTQLKNIDEDASPSSTRGQYECFYRVKFQVTYVSAQQNR